jgi:hypothetical protein
MIRKKSHEFYRAKFMIAENGYQDKKEIGKVKRPLLLPSPLPTIAGSVEKTD